MYCKRLLHGDNRCCSGAGRTCVYISRDYNASHHLLRGGIVASVEATWEEPRHLRRNVFDYHNGNGYHRVIKTP